MLKGGGKDWKLAVVKQFFLFMTKARATVDNILKNYIEMLHSGCNSSLIKQYVNT